MTRAGLNLSIVILSALLAFVSNAGADATSQAPDFNEVYELIRTHLVGTTEAELNRMSVDGLLTQLQGRVSIAAQETTNAAAGMPLTSRPDVLDDGVAYLRVERIADGLADALSAAWRRLSATNQLIGLALDLRFAGGTDYQAAAAAADLFTAKEQLLLDWSSGQTRSKAKSDAITLPVAVLVNRQTSGAAEALAAVLRQTGVGLILGRATAGTAMAAQAFPLKSGQSLLIATKPVTLGDGSALSTQGVKPDIEVVISAEAEREYFEDAYATLASPGSRPAVLFAGRAAETNRASRRARVSEADLVRERREGMTNLDELVPAREREPEKPPIRDPVLARAVDLLKGLAVVRGAHP